MNVRRPIYAALVCAALFAVQARADDKNPLEKAKAGQWIVQKSTTKYGGMANTSLSYTWVDKVDGRKVILKVQSLNADGKTAMAPATEMPMDLDAKSPGGEKKEGPKPTVSDEEIEVAGKKIKCQKTEMTMDVAGVGKMTSITWSSPDVPIYGTVKSISKDKDGNETSVVETIEWGQDGAKEKPVGGAAAPPSGGDEGMGGKKDGE